MFSERQGSTLARAHGLTVNEQTRRDDREYIRELSRRIAAWDPIGLLAIGAPKNEYDCLVAPVVSGLKGGLGSREFARLLRERIVEHFGVEPTGPDRFAVEIIEWHRSRLK